jgi:hypothetical protein
MKVVKLSALRIGRLYSPGNIPGTHFSTTEKMTAMKNSSDTIGNRTCDVPAYSAVPQPAAPPPPLIVSNT